VESFPGFSWVDVVLRVRKALKLLSTCSGGPIADAADTMKQLWGIMAPLGGDEQRP
jgi:hypothetical protein